MPTGYTAAIADGIDFNTYAWSCARAMGALIMMRDEPADAPIPERFEPSDYHTKKLEEAHATLAKLETMAKEEAAQAAELAYSVKVQERDNTIWKAHELRRKYETMLAQVKAWVPPTPDHEGFKQFMAEQIIQSISFDCDISYLKPIQKLSPMEWLASSHAEAMRDISYHEAEHAKEVERANGRSAWVAKLRESLKP
jgi:hypothetical protein